MEIKFRSRIRKAILLLNGEIDIFLKNWIDTWQEKLMKIKNWKFHFELADTNNNENDGGWNELYYFSPLNRRKFYDTNFVGIVII